jgi:hypothetical protein
MTAAMTAAIHGSIPSSRRIVRITANSPIRSALKRIQFLVGVTPRV